MPENHTNMDLCRYRLAKSEEYLADAKLLFEHGSIKSSNNRAYYSIFHALRAVLAIDGVEFKKHSGNIQYFLREHVKTGHFDAECSDIVLSASRIRNASDYDDFYVASKSETEIQVKDAEKFLNTVRDYISKNLPENQSS